MEKSDLGSACKAYVAAAEAGASEAWKSVARCRLRDKDTAGAVSAFERYVATMPGARDTELVRKAAQRLGGAR